MCKCNTVCVWECALFYSVVLAASGCHFFNTDTVHMEHFRSKVMRSQQQ